MYLASKCNIKSYVSILFELLLHFYSHHLRIIFKFILVHNLVYSIAIRSIRLIN